MLKDIIEERQKKARENYRLAEQQWEFSPTDLDKEIAETAQIVAREVLRKVREGAKGREIISDKKLQFVNPHIKTWEDGYNFAIDDTLTHLQSLEEELTK
jgi:hypothetical protein